MIERLKAVREELTVTDQFVLVTAALSPVAWAPVFLFDSAPRVALALALLPLGVLSLVRLARQRDAASIVALLLSGTAVASALLSPAPLNSLMGSLDWWTGAIGLVTGLGWWGLGRQLSCRARSLLIPALTVGALWNALIALAQVVFTIDTGTLATSPGRGSGTMLNPVYYGAFLSGVLAIWLFLSSGSRRSALLIASLSLGVGLGGGRMAVGIAFVVGVAAVIVRPERWTAVRNLGLTVLGVYAATLVVPSENESSAVTARVAAGSGGGVRRAIWQVGLDAVKDRPLFGWGPGNIEIATERHFDMEYTRGQLATVGSMLRWTDTHNMILNVMVGMGLLGGVLAVVFVGLSIRSFLGARHEQIHRAMYAGAFAMAANWMLQPSTIHTVPIALLLLGSSMPRLPSVDQAADRSRVEGSELRLATVTAVERRVMAIGVAVGALLLCDLLIVDRALRYGNLDVANAVARYGYSDPFVDDLLAGEHRLAILDRDRDLMLGRAAWFANRERQRYPVHHAAGMVGELAYSRGDVEAALAAELDALDLQPWSPLTNRRLLVLAEATGDRTLYERSMQALCLVGDDACEDAGDGVGAFGATDG